MSQPQQEAPPAVSLAALFFGFTKIGLSGFGGVLPFARHYLVDTSRWLSAEEFNALLGFCQFLPGPNVVNLSVVVGKRYQGWRGAVVAPVGLLLGPFLVALLLALAYDRWGELPEVQRMLRGIAAAGAGLLFGMAVRMALAVREKRVYLPFTLGVAIAVAGLRWSLPAVMGVGIVLAGGVAWWRQGRHARERAR